MTKKFLPAYEHLKLVKGYRYYIKVKADTKNGGKRLFRHTFNLNRILNLPERILRGEELVKKIRFWLDLGNFYEDFDERLVTLEMRLNNSSPKKQILLIDAIEEIRDTKVAETERRSSKRSHNSHTRQFIEFLKAKDWERMSVEEFTREHARAYTMYWVQKGINNNNTFNTKLIFVKGYFNTFIEAEYIDQNPFDRIKRRRKTKAIRQNIELKDMVVLNQLAKDKNIWLWVSIQLAFWGLVRQEELSRLKFKNFDFKNWCIRLSAEDTKNWKDDVITLPFFLREQFKEIDFFQYPANYYLIGKGIKPGLERVEERQLHKRFLSILNLATREKLIDNKKGISFSSWRRTGMDYFSHCLPPRLFKDHNRHDSFSTTEHYLPNRKVIDKVSLLENDVFVGHE